MSWVVWFMVKLCVNKHQLKVRRSEILSSRLAFTMSWVVWLLQICVLPKVLSKTEDSILQAISNSVGLRLYG